MPYVQPGYLIEPQALAETLGQPGLKVVDTTVHLKPAEKGYRAESGLEDYERSHVPGALFMDQIRAVSDTSTGLGFSLPGPEALQAALRDLGLSNGDKVVVYSSGHMMWATRAWWLLHYAGIEDLAVLNGGFRAWLAAGLETRSGPERGEAGDLDVAPRSAIFTGRDDVLASIDRADVCTVNALSPDVYSGTAEMSYGRKGHITGSINLHYEELLEDGRFRSAEALESVLADRGLLDAGRVITYCGGGISATIDAFACLLVGKEEVTVYDGSMSEWVRDEQLPMTTGDAPG